MREPTAFDIEQLQHPGPRAKHNLLNIMQELRDPASPTSRADLASALENVVLDVAALHEYTERQESNLRDMCQESLDAAREITALRAKLDAATAAIERLYEHESDELRQTAQRFSALCTVRDTLRAESIRPYVIRMQSTSRTAAGA